MQPLSEPTHRIDTLAVVTFEVTGDEETARKTVHGMQEAEYSGGPTPTYSDGNIDLHRIRLASISTRMEPAVVEVYDDSGPGRRIIAEPRETFVDPEETDILTEKTRTNLTEAVAALRKCADGDSNDEEIDAAIGLADLVEALLAQQK